MMFKIVPLLSPRIHCIADRYEITKLKIKVKELLNEPLVIHPKIVESKSQSVCNFT